jgi:hypothetical protein
MSDESVSQGLGVAKEFLALGREGLALFARFLGPPGDEAVGYVADWMKFHRARQQLAFNRLLQQTRAELDARGVEPQPVPPKILQPIVEAAALEEEPELAVRWAALLASASTTGVHPSFPSILRELSRKDAQLLQRVGEIFLAQQEHWVARDKAHPLSAERHKRAYPEERTAIDADFKAGADNLLRLGLCEVPVLIDGHLDRNMRYEPGKLPGRDYAAIRLTSLGVWFLQACTPKAREPGSDQIS